MRMSCNGCRVLRKGCSDDCVIRPCLQWIKSADAQANATVFLAKFYGRAGLINLINAGPPPLRPAIFRSLLYEACGRIINPIYGSVGLLWSGNWGHCQAAVDAVLKGSPHIMRHPSLDSGSTPAASQPLPALKPYDIRHFPKEGGSQHLHGVGVRARPRFKRPRLGVNLKPDSWLYPEASYATSPEDDSGFSVETVEAEPEDRSQPSRSLAFEGRESDDDGIGLELTLGVAQSQQQSVSCKSEADHGHHL